MKLSIAIIGGGASGMAAAIAAATEGACVTIYEGNDRLGKKILATGNGKCNLGNLMLSADLYNSSNQELLENCFRRFGTQETIRFFQQLGLMVKDKNQYLYPVSEQASSVLDVLRKAVEHLKITVVFNAKIEQIVPQKGGYFNIVWSGKTVRHDKVIVACGSKAAPKTGSDGSGYQLAQKLGMKLVNVVPALVQLKCAEAYCKAIAGVRTDAEIHICKGNHKITSERGELQLTEYGISGIPVFQLSGLVNRYIKENPGQLVAEIDFLPDISDKEWYQFAKDRILRFRNAVTVEDFFNGMLNKKLMLLFIKLAGLKTDTPLSYVEDEKLMNVFQLCKHFVLHITGSNSFENAQICAGGISLKEVNTDLEALKVKGLYFVGEILDVDGRCGGYNLQWAWTSGNIAGRAAAKKSKKVKIVKGKAESC